MPSIICGSLAFDSIAVFPGRFADQILPDQLHILNVSFLVPDLRREYGGCAGNIAYNLAGLGGQAVVVATVGTDGAEYVERLRSLGVVTRHIGVDHDAVTAQAYIMTDAANNQISAFHPGAMQSAHRTPVPTLADTVIGIVAPDGREAMLVHAEQFAAAGVPFIFDPGQGLPMFDGPALQAFVDRATWVTVNDYEARMLADRTGRSMQEQSRSAHLRGVVVTLGEDGAEIWRDGTRTHVPGLVPTGVVDPTGCGDAFRAGLLFGLEREWPLEKAVALGNRLGATKIASRGGQNHVVDRTILFD
jgi:adenosine kinase